MAGEQKDWKDILFGTQSPPPGTTSQPEQRTQWEQIAAQTRNAGQAAGDLADILKGQQPSPVRVCSEGHLVPSGSTVCVQGHYVG